MTAAIRPEQPADYDAVHQVVVAAFEAEAEGTLVKNIRASSGYIPELSLVATIDEQVVGHLMISVTGLVDGEVHYDIHSLAPVAVAPEQQGRGIGGQLIEAVLAAANELGLPFVVLEGSPAYYRRFGFEHSELHGISFDLPDWAPPEAAQMIRLSSYDPAVRGRVVYPESFNVVT